MYVAVEITQTQVWQEPELRSTACTTPGKQLRAEAPISRSRGGSRSHHGRCVRQVANFRFEAHMLPAARYKRSRGIGRQKQRNDRLLRSEQTSCKVITPGKIPQIMHNRALQNHCSR